MSRFKLPRYPIVVLHFLLPLLFGVAATRPQAASVAPVPHPRPNGIVGALYTGNETPRRDLTAASILRLASWRSFLYVALRDAAGNELVDVWDLTRLDTPRLADVIEFGNVLTNRVQLIPAALIARDGKLVVQTASGLRLYRQGADGRLEFDRQFSLVTGLGDSAMNQLSVAGPFASHLQQVIPNPQITAGNLPRIRQEVVIDFSRPEAPVPLWAGPTHGGLALPTPINAVFDGQPASLTFDPVGNTATLTRLEHRLEAHLADFWGPKLEAIFRGGALDQSLGALIRAAFARVDLEALQSSTIERYARALGHEGLSLRGLISLRADPGRELIAVLREHGIDLDDPLELAVEKLVYRGFDGELEAALAATLHSAVLDAWLREILPLGPEIRSLADLQARAAAVMNGSLNTDTLIEHLTLKLISPLLGNPRFMTMTLEELVSFIARSEVGTIIDTTLQTAGGFGTLNGALDAIDTLPDLLETLLGVSLPGLPDCARFPESTRELLRLALYSWNASFEGQIPGPRANGVLNPRGLAWFELLKFYRYLNGDTDFARYFDELDARLRALQTDLAGDVTKRLSSAFAFAADAQAELGRLQADFAASLPARPIVGRIVAQATIRQIQLATDLDARLSVRAALHAWGIRIAESGQPEPLVTDLLAALDARGAGAISLESIFSAAARFDLRTLGRELEQTLRLQLQATFGVGHLDLSLRHALERYLVYQVDLDGILGDALGTLLNEVLQTAPQMHTLLSNVPRAFSGDCIAQWMLALRAVALGTAIVDGGLAATALNAALETAYSVAIDHAVRVMLGVMIDEVVERWSSRPSHWLAAQLAPRTTRHEVFQFANPNTRTTRGAFAWEDRIGFIVETRFAADPFGPRQMELIRFHPDAPAETRATFDLGRWQNLNHVSSAGGAVILSGLHFPDAADPSPKNTLLLVDLTSNPPQVQMVASVNDATLASGSLLSTVREGAVLAVAAEDRVLLLLNPAAYARAEETPARPLEIVVHPESQTVPAGTRVRLRVRASGTAPLTYQWFRDGELIPGASTAHLERAVFGEAETGEYRVEITNPAGTVVSRRARLAVLAPERLVITRQPRDRAVFQGQRLSLTVETTGDATIGYQWFFEGVELPGANAAELALASVANEHAGRYRVVVSNAHGAVASEEARVIVLPGQPPEVFAFAGSQWLTYREPSALRVHAAGAAPLSFQWFKNGQAIPGATESVLRFEQTEISDAGTYFARVASATGFLDTPPIVVRLTTGLRLETARSPDGAVSLRLDGGRAGDGYAVQVSEDLVNWQNVESVVDSGEARQFLFTPNDGSGRQFFRVVITPR